MIDPKETKTVVLIASALNLDLTKIKNFSVYCDGVANYPVVKVEYYAHRTQSEIKNKSSFINQRENTNGL